MKMCEALVAWNPRTDQIEVGRLIEQGEADWTDPYEMTGGAAYVAVRGLHGVEARHRAMSDFIGIVIRDGVNISAAYREFRKIDEFVAAIPLDMPKVI